MTKLGDDNIKGMMNAENAKGKWRNKNGGAARRSNAAGEQKQIAEGGKNKRAEESSICGRPHSLQNLPLYSKPRHMYLKAYSTKCHGTPTNGMRD